MNSIYIHTHERANDTSRVSRVELIQVELTSFVRTELNLYEYVSFNMRTDYCVHDRLICFLN